MKNYRYQPRTTVQARAPAGKVETIHDAVPGGFPPDRQNTVNLTANGGLRTFGFTDNHTELTVH